MLEADPPDDIRNTARLRDVVKNAEVFEVDTLDRVWPEPRPLPQPYWWNDGPDSDPSLRMR